MRPREEQGWIRRSLSHAHRLTLEIWMRYKRLNWLGKTVLYSLIVFHILLAVALIHIGADNLFQYLYDLSQSVRNSTHGWWILALVMSTSTTKRARRAGRLLTAIAVISSVPPLVGFTTLISVCGFAWGIKGFLLACPATFLGAGFSFLLLRFVFKSRLKRLSETNDRWRALEEVVVRRSAFALGKCASNFQKYRKQRACLLSFSFDSHLCLHGCTAMPSLLLSKASRSGNL